MPEPQAIEGRRRVAIENVQPTVDAGRFVVKRIVGDTLNITANVFADGHDIVRALLLWRIAPTEAWTETPLTLLGNDEWRAELALDTVGRLEFTIRGWVDAFDTWQHDLVRRIEANQDISIDLQIGAQLVGQAAERAKGEDAKRLKQWQAVLASGSAGQAKYQAGAQELAELMQRNPDLRFATECEPPYAVVVDRERARFSSWYELFPRSCSRVPNVHGTLADCGAWLPRLAEMGFDVVYLPPIHPVGNTFRKGKNNATTAAADNFGSPWAIGAADGGHKAILKDLGTLADLHKLVATAGALGIDVALDIAFQCSPDHPYVKEHPQWFRQRPDGTVQYAENPPKKYQDIYPFDFENPDWQALWQELTDVVLYWCQQGIRIFRVDNPHTKPFAFWEFLITQVKAKFPEALFLSEAFTRPKIMYRLAKLGFTQSYTYFTWRNTKAELAEYLTELTQTELREFFGPNLWPNTPDILPPHLQTGGRPAFVARLVLAATLGSNYGIYGPAYELLDHEPRDPGSEEYRDSEKYQLRQWDFSRPEGLHDVIAAVNKARHENVALQSNESLQFHLTDNEQIICYSKRDKASGNLIVTVVNLSFQEEQHGFITLPLAELGIDPDRPYQLQDLLNGPTFAWQGPRNFVELEPHHTVAHIFKVSQ